ncbi:phosphoenolpyruvate synthase [Fluviicola sp.]|jgi:pyruvate,water dikinase|uniref:phosphoenolpyruvate synthase n=1 Tax=Fluviicola sp. TaxID=1917219 RepID=UPI002826B2E5|nr:phosphoenolpyruvate synthase [Fluviicola sp.]MDR0802010.1 phosphoenolpyruvate synthase [Fluviicola sp.]
MKKCNAYILDFNEIDQKSHSLVGGKGANLGELYQIGEEVQVPDGFCITTEAYRKMTENHLELNRLLNELNQFQAKDRKAITKISSQIRQTIVNIRIPEELTKAITERIHIFGEQQAYAVRSSATAEDLPTASFAGQQDTFLNVIGKEAILQHISQCWASLFTDRAVIYRIQNGFGHSNIWLSVIIQKMVFPQVSGILFTADPVTSSRTVSSIDAGYGLGEALVSGLINADNYQIQNGKLIGKTISVKKSAIYALKNGGTIEQELESGLQHSQALTDEQILQIERIGRKIEAHFDCPQDIEWCLADGTFYVVQSRPVTTLFPIPKTSDPGNHVYVSVGHQQMMTDAMKPLGLSVWQLSTSHPMHLAGGRLFLEITKQLTSQAGREILLNTLGKSDPLSKDALMHIMERNIIPLTQDKNQESPTAGNKLTSPAIIRNDPKLVTGLIRQNMESINTLKQQIQAKSGSELMDFILEDLNKLKQILFDPQSFAALMAGINASAWINFNMQEWLGEKNAADALSQSLDNNVTSEMGLALLDVADVIRPFPEVVAFLQQTKDEHFLDQLPAYPGGNTAREAIENYLDKYGMRCPGEIDITKTRWSENPVTLVPLILSNIQNFKPGESKRKFEQGRGEALEKERSLLDRLKQLPGGEEKVEETREKIAQLRIFSGYREFPKYIMINRFFVYKQSILKEAEKLVSENVISEKEAVFYLTFHELYKALQIRQVDRQLIHKRKEDFRNYEKLTPPRFLVSDGEIITGRYKREDLPENALAGLAVSSGVIEGRARVILDMKEANIEDSDILVTRFTDPSWTPLFVSVKGLVTEVGGLMTHGAVIAREYGLPAVVGVENACQLIPDGQRIRVNGSEGWVEIL